MPRELFSPSVVGVSSVARRTRLLPLSVAVHMGLIGTVLALPVVADTPLPPPAQLWACRLGPPPLRLVAALPLARHRSQHSTVRADVAPLVTPAAIPSIEPIGPGDLHSDENSPGGVSSCVPGGVVAGIATIPIEPPPTPGPHRVGGQIRQPIKLHDVDPVYPAIAQRAHVEGIVILEAVIDEYGRVSDTRVLRSIRCFDDAAEAAVRQWVYSPTLLNGQPIPVVMTVTVQFKLER